MTNCRHLIIALMLLGATTATAQEARSFQYLPDGHDFVCQDGTNRYTRALYGSHTEYRVETSDRPIFAIFRKREGWFPLLAPCSAAVLCYAVQALFSFSVCIVAPMFWILLGLSFREQS